MEELTFFIVYTEHRGECQSNRCIYLKISKYQEYKTSISLPSLYYAHSINLKHICMVRDFTFLKP